MRVLMAGGGTAGHVNPALSIAQFIKARRPGAEILFVGTKEGLESRLVPAAGFSFKAIKVYGFKRSFSLSNIRTVKSVFTSVKEAKRLIEEYSPDVVVGTGGYASFPVLYAASRRGIPTAIHEQNAYPGITSRLLSRWVDRVMTSFEGSEKYFYKKAAVTLVGNPIREGFVFSDKSAARKKLGMSESEKYIVSFAGSLGAREFNLAMIDFIALHAPEKKLKHTHATGKFGYRWMPGKLLELGIDGHRYPLVDLREYIDDMQTVMAAADLVIGRGGANTISELLALGKPSILVPSPNVTHNHQYYNVKTLSDRGAAIMLEERNLSGKRLKSLVDELFSSPDKMKGLSEKAYEMAIYDSSQKIYNVICELTGSKKQNGG